MNVPSLRIGQATLLHLVLTGILLPKLPASFTTTEAITTTTTMPWYIDYGRRLKISLSQHIRRMS